MKILIINLEQSKDRLEQQHIQFSKLGLTFERLSAVSIQDFNEAEYKELAFSGQRPLKQSELACFLSHKKAWQHVVSVNEPCVILEDDAVLVKDLKIILAQIEDLNDVEFVNLEVHGRKKIVSKLPIYQLDNDKFQLYHLYQDRSGTGGYIIFPQGAQRLLDYMKQRSIGLADEFIYSCQTLKAYQIEPAALLQSDKCQQYDVETHIPYQSVIASVKNSLQFDLSTIDKIQFKTRRINRQLQLGYLNIKNGLKGAKRDIQVDPNLF